MSATEQRTDGQGSGTWDRYQPTCKRSKRNRHRQKGISVTIFVVFLSRRTKDEKWVVLGACAGKGLGQKNCMQKQNPKFTEKERHAQKWR